jgi:hypothetical protein
MLQVDGEHAMSLFTVGDGTYLARVLMVTYGDKEVLWVLMRLPGESRWTARWRVRDIVTNKREGESFVAELKPETDVDVETERTAQAFVSTLQQMMPDPAPVAVPIVSTVQVDSDDYDTIVGKLQPFFHFPISAKGGTA